MVGVTSVDRHVPSTARGLRGGGDPLADGIVVVTMLKGVGHVGVQTHVAQVTDLLGDRAVLAGVVRPGSAVPVVGPALLAPARALRRLDREPAVRLERAWHRRVLEAGLRRELGRLRPAVMYAQDPRSAAAALGARGTARTPVVMAVHYNESQAQELVERGMIGAGGPADVTIRRFEADLMPRLDGLVFVSEFMRRHVQEVVPACRRVRSVVIPNFLGAEADRVSSGPVDVSGDCITVGSLVDRKNHRFLLEVLAAARRQGHRYTLTVVGGGPLREALERHADRLGVGDQVTFTGARTDVDQLLAAHRVYVHSATVENLPFALLEAMRAGLPVIAAPVGGIPEILGDQRAGRYWSLSDATSAGRVLQSLLEDPWQRADTGASARRLFEDRFSVAAVGDHLLDFLRVVARSAG